MKKNLLLFMILVLAGIVKLHAQACSVSNLVVEIKSTTDNGTGGCLVTLDATFIGKFNNGNKYAFIHLWETANYPDPAIEYDKAPTAGQLSQALATFVIEDPSEVGATIHNVYVPSPGVIVKSAGLVHDVDTFRLTNVVIDLSTCGAPVPVVGDVWASQGDNAQKPQCFTNSAFNIIFNNTIVSGIKQCSNPRLINFSIKNAHILDESVEVSAYVDVNENGVVNDAIDIDITGLISTAFTNPINLAANSTTSFSGLSYLPYSGDPVYAAKPILIVASATTPGTSTVVYTKSINFIPGVECAPLVILPVTFTSFTAKRDESNVLLQWETSSEENNTGFAVERNINGTWVQVAFIPSQAAGGNSSSKLIYKYEDLNAAKTISQYRLKQVDIDGRFKYSQIRSVFGNAQEGKVIVYPNPSNNGNVSVVFEEANGIHEVSLVDMTGRLLKQWKTAYNNIQIDNLTTGVYHLRIVSRQTGNQTIEKIVVSRQ